LLILYPSKLAASCGSYFNELFDSPLLMLSYTIYVTGLLL